MTRNLLPLLAALPLLACTPAGDKADTGEAIAEGAGVGEGPSGRVGDPVAKGAENGPIPADIDEGLEPLPAPANSAGAQRDAAGLPGNAVEPPGNRTDVYTVEPALPIDPPR